MGEPLQEDRGTENPEANPAENPAENRVVAYHERNKRRGWWMIGGVLLLALVGAFLLSLVSPPPDNTAKMGVHLLLDDGRNAWDEALWPQHMGYAAQVGHYVTQLITLDDLNVERWQPFMDEAESLGLIPIIRLATTWDGDCGCWAAPVADENGRYTEIAGQYAAFLAALEFPDGVQKFIIVGNEPNHGDEWGGRPDPAAYARFLIDVSAALKAQVSNVKVLNAAFDFYAPHTGSQPFEDGFYYMDAETFIDEMFSAEPAVFTVIDAWNSHAYAKGAPWEGVYQVDYLNDASNPNAAPPPRLLHNRGVNSYEWALFKLNALGVNRVLPVFITETGWNTDDAGDMDAGDMDAETAALYMDLAYRGNKGRYPDLPETGWVPWLDDGRVVAVTPFALNGAPDEWSAFNWLEMSAEGEILGTRPVYERMKALYSGE